jgi:hypothetical protein
MGGTDTPRPPAVPIVGVMVQEPFEKKAPRPAVIPTNGNMREAHPSSSIAVARAFKKADESGDQRREARLKGYEGDACGECGQFTMVRNGTCLKCISCGATSGCS